MRDPLQLSILAISGALADVRQEVHAYLEACVDEPCVDDVKLAVHELVANSIVHGYAGRSPGLVEITVAVSSTCIRVRVRDFGRGFYANAQSPGAGRGRRVLASLAREVVERQPEAGGHEVLLVLPRRAPTAQNGRLRPLLQGC